MYVETYASYCLFGFSGFSIAVLLCRYGCSDVGGLPKVFEEGTIDSNLVVEERWLCASLWGPRGAVGAPETTELLVACLMEGKRDFLLL